MSDNLQFGGDEAAAPASGGGDDRFQAGPWHVRFAGRRTGPHDVERLRTLARRGAVTRLHQVSVDGTAWRSAAEIRSVFAADGTVIAGGGAPVAGVQLGDDRLDLPDTPTEDAMPAAPVVRRFTAGIASVRPVVVAALVLATVVLVLPTSRDESGALAWWWSEGPFSIAARGMAVLAVIGGWSVAFGKQIGMGYVRPDLATPGTKLKVKMLRQEWDAVVTEDSPFDPTNARIRIDG